MRKFRHVVASVLVLSLLSCKGDFTVTDKANGGEGTIPSSNLSFSGISTIDNVSGVSARLNWTHVSGAAQYQVFNVTSGNSIWVATLNAPTASYTVTGLTPGTSYKFRVRLMDSEGRTDQNKNDQNITTTSVAAAFEGWTHIKAVGAKAPAPQGSDLSSAPAAVTLSWEAATPSSGTVASYNIYRATMSGGYNYNTPLATGISAATRAYTDSTVTGGIPYYYTIALVVSGVTVIPDPATDLEATVIVPKENMVLLHRWAANKEMCEQMGKTVERNNNYRCMVATGANAPPGTGGSGYVDLEKSLFVDMFEQGCNYTAANSCVDASLNGGTPSPCIGTRNGPNGNVTAPAGSIYYSRSNGNCYFNNSGGPTGNSWVAATSASIAQREAMGSNAPGLPPFAIIDQLESQDVCKGQSVSGFAGVKRLLKRREHVLVSAWDASLTDNTITDMENGQQLHTSGHCNSNYASPQGNNDTDITPHLLGYDNEVIPVAKDTLPGCRNGDCSGTASSIRSVRTGSNATQNCVSRYGAQDLVGNVWEWTSDQINCTGTSCTGLPGTSNTVDTTNDDMTGVAFDGTQGPNSSNTFATWGRIQLPIGIPIASVGFTGDGVVTRTSTQFHGDYFWVNIANAVRGSRVGGSWRHDSRSGRFALLLDNDSTNTASNLGFRCALPAE